MRSRLNAKSAKPIGICALMTAFLSSSSRSMTRSEEHTSELQSLRHLVCRLLLEKKRLPTAQDASRTPARHAHTGANGGRRARAMGSSSGRLVRRRAGGPSTRFLFFFERGGPPAAPPPFPPPPLPP